jgi:hypothetical protein
MNVTGLEHYVGQKVSVTETKKIIHLKTIGDQEFAEYDVADDDTTISKLREEMKHSELHLRLWLPNTSGTTDYRMDRLNVHVDKQDDGSFEITKVNIG